MRTPSITMKHFTAVSYLFMSSKSIAFSPRAAMSVLRAAKSQILRRPTLTHAVVGSVLFGASDAFAQKIESSAVLKDDVGNNSNKEDSMSVGAFSTDHFDAMRFVSAGCIGALLSGYVYPFAYRQLDILWKGKSFVAVAKKSLLEVFTVGVFANSISMAARGVLGGKTPSDVAAHVKEEMPEVTFNDLRVWFPYNLVAFSFIPISVRPATTSLMEALWQTYISLRSNDYEHQNEECEASSPLQQLSALKAKAKPIAFKTNE